MLLMIWLLVCSPADLEDMISSKEVLDVLVAAMDSYDNNVTVNEQATFALSKILVTNGKTPPSCDHDVSVCLSLPALEPTVRTCI